MTAVDLTAVEAPDLPEWLRGAWRRVLLRTPDGAEDRATEVLWLQTGCLFADIRIPADRPSLAGRRGVEDCAADELVKAASVRAFAGWTQFHAGVCRWTRPIDFQPPTGQEDAGRMALRDGALWEYGLRDDYAEEYVRVASGGSRIAAWALQPDAVDPRPGVLVIVDGLVMRAIGRPRALPVGDSLADLVLRHRDDRDVLRQLFDCEISLAAADGLVVTRSTLPWREGSRLAPSGAFRYGSGPDELIEEGDPPRLWHRRGTGPDAPTLARLLNGA